MVSVSLFLDTDFVSCIVINKWQFFAFFRFLYNNRDNFNVIQIEFIND